MLSRQDWCDYLGDDVTWERGQGGGGRGARVTGVTGAGGEQG